MYKIAHLLTLQQLVLFVIKLFKEFFHSKLSEIYFWKYIRLPLFSACWRISGSSFAWISSVLFISSWCSELSGIKMYNTHDKWKIKFPKKCDIHRMKNCNHCYKMFSLQEMIITRQIFYAPEALVWTFLHNKRSKPNIRKPRM